MDDWWFKMIRWTRLCPSGVLVCARVCLPIRLQMAKKRKGVRQPRMSSLLYCMLVDFRFLWPTCCLPSLSHFRSLFICSSGVDVRPSLSCFICHFPLLCRSHAESKPKPTKKSEEHGYEYQINTTFLQKQGASTALTECLIRWAAFSRPSFCFIWPLSLVFSVVEFQSFGHCGFRAFFS